MVSAFRVSMVASSAAIRSGLGLPRKMAPNMSRFAPSERRPTFSIPSQRKVRVM